ncbi:MAG TPA: TadE/TadG family type IV pilus assembly protein [Sphingomicrobium sp.]|nr:TadE/TadG family type IV pilus assembly protein [Sphingomicrobium sp.]
MMRRLFMLKQDERGAALVELALAAPFLAALLIGIIDLSRAYSMKYKLEQSAQRAVEKIEQQQSVQTDYSPYGTEATTAATAAGYSGSTATVDYWLECDGVRQSNTTTPCNTGQTYARYVTITVNNTYTPFFSSRAWPGADAQGNIPISGYAGIRVQ